MKKVSATGGVPVVISTQQQVSEAVSIKLHVISSVIIIWPLIYPDEIFDAVGDQLYFATQSKTPGHLLTMLNLNTLTQSNTVDTGAYFQAAIDFDVTNRKTYVCNAAMSESTGAYSIDRYVLKEKFIRPSLPFISILSASLLFSPLLYPLSCSSLSPLPFQSSLSNPTFSYPFFLSSPLFRILLFLNFLYLLTLL